MYYARAWKNKDYCTIMYHNPWGLCRDIPYFSSPDLNYDGQTIGDRATDNAGWFIMTWVPKILNQSFKIYTILNTTIFVNSESTRMLASLASSCFLRKMFILVTPMKPDFLKLF